MGFATIPLGVTAPQTIANDMPAPEPDQGWTWAGTLTEKPVDEFEFTPATNDDALIEAQAVEAEIIMINNPSDEDLLGGGDTPDAGIPAEADLDMLNDFAIDIPVDFGLPTQF